MTAPVVPTPTAPAVQAKSIFLSRTFWGSVVAALVPMIQPLLAGTYPTAPQVGTTIGLIIAAAGITGKVSRIEAFIAQVAASAAK